MAPRGARGDGRTLLAKVVAGVAALVICACSLAAASYVSGSDPLAFLAGDAFRTVEEPPSATVAVSLADASEAQVEDASTSGDADVTPYEAAATDGSEATPDADAAESQASGGQSSEGGGSGVAPASSSPDKGSAGGSAPAASSSSSSVASSPKKTTISVKVTVDASKAGGGSSSATVELPAGASAYDALVATGVDVNARASSFGTYVAAIGGIAEGLKGHPTSGWKYSVNGSDPSRSAAKVAVHDGDVVRWRYVLDENG